MNFGEKIEITREYLEEQGYSKRRDLTLDERKEMAKANYYFQKKSEFEQLANAHVQRFVANMVIKNGTSEFQLLDEKELYVRKG